MFGRSPFERPLTVSQGYLEMLYVTLLRLNNLEEFHMLAERSAIECFLMRYLILSHIALYLLND